MLQNIKSEGFEMTIQELVEQMKSEGFKITPRTIKFYVEMALMPQPVKRGGYQEGVRLVFEEPEKAIERLRLIFALKGKGYKLSDIRAEIDRVREREKLEKQKSELQRYVEIEGRVYYDLGPVSEAHFLSCQRLDILLRESGPYQYSFEACGPLEMWLEASKQVQERGFSLPQYVSKGAFLYDETALFGPSSWIIMNLEYDLGWDTLTKLFEVSKKNLDRFFHWPDTDGERVSSLSIRWARQKAENEFGIPLKNYLEWMSEGFSLGDDYPFFGVVNPSFRYSNREEFVSDFVSGRCAFVPMYPDDDGPVGAEMFLKKF